MAPTIPPGTTLLLDPSSPALGDVVLLEAGGQPVLHRLVARLPGGLGFLHRGDAPSARPGRVLARRIRGVARSPRRPPERREQLAAIVAWVRAVIGERIRAARDQVL